MHFFGILAAILALTGVSAHPGDDIVKEAQAREAVINQLQHKSLAHCADKLKRSGIEAQSIARRSSLATELMTKNNLISKSPLPIPHPKLTPRPQTAPSTPSPSTTTPTTPLP